MSLLAFFEPTVRAHANALMHAHTHTATEKKNIQKNPTKTRKHGISNARLAHTNSGNVRLSFIYSIIFSFISI